MFSLLEIIVVYFYIYAPPFQIFPIGVDKPIFIWSIFYLSYNGLWRKIYQTFKIEWSSLIFIVLVSSFVALIHRKDNSLFFYDLLLLLECITSPFAIFHFFSMKNVISIDKVVVICSIAGACVSCFLLLNPEYAQFVKSTLIKYPEQLVDRFVYRGYGLSDGLLFSYPVIQGFCFSFILIGIGGKNILVKLSLLLVFVSIMANARSGFIPIVITLCLILLHRTCHFFKLTFSVCIFSVLFASSISLFLEQNPMLQMASEWAKTSIDIFMDALSGERTENVDALLGDMVVWPSSVDEWLIGTGRNFFSNNIVNTDVGYFIRLNYGGIVYVGLWLFLCLYMFKRLNKHNRGLALIFFLSLIYMNYKADFFVVNPASRFFFFIYVFALQNSSLFNNLLNQRKVE